METKFTTKSQEALQAAAMNASTAGNPQIEPAHLLKALLAKGWVKAQNFQRSDRKLGYLYVLTPAGIRQRLRLTQAFLARKEREFVALRSQISALRKDLANQEGPRP